MSQQVISEVSWRPDWRNSNAYPRLEDEVPIKRWQWEFLRRHTDYESDYARYVEAQEKTSDDAWGDSVIVEERGPKSVEVNFEDRLLNKYGVSILLPARLNWKAGGDVENCLQFEGGVEWVTFRKGTRRYWSLRPECEGDVVLRLNTKVPLQQNLDWVEDVLKRNKMAADQRYRPQDYTLYLQLLDAIYTGAKTKEITAHFNKNALPKVPLMPDDNRKRTIRQSKTKAMAMAATGYRTLHLRAIS